LKTISNITFTLSLLGAISCAPATPPRDLVSARTAYSRASSGPTARLNPRDLDTAKTQLALAEASFRDEGDTQKTRDEAYLALRRAEIAVVVGETRHIEAQKAATVAEMHADETRTVAATSAELAQVRTDGAAKDAAFAAQGVTLQTQSAALRDEKALRLDAEQRARKAAADLAAFASVKQETRGMVITLSDGVLFASARSDLLPAAQVKLNAVADALIKEDPLSKMMVEGHTDSQGSGPYNQDLSERRAQSVRDYLVSRGIASDRIGSQGFGFTRSVADNGSAEGRANNRRVEIVVRPAGAS
jgi:outer membrane protein OmpA-like peptidoglycan-associated protein